MVVPSLHREKEIHHCKNLKHRPANEVFHYKETHRNFIYLYYEHQYGEMTESGSEQLKHYICSYAWI